MDCARARGNSKEFLLNSQTRVDFSEAFGSFREHPLDSQELVWTSDELPGASRSPR